MKRNSLLLAVCLLLSFTAVSSAATWLNRMTGGQEVPPNSSPATGFTTVTLTGDLLSVDVVWNNLTGGDPGAAHIHCCTAPGTNIGVAVGFPNFPATTSGTYSNVFDLLDPLVYTTNFLNNFGGGTAIGARDALITGLNSGMAYSNIHNATFPGGEIRANLAAIPEPSSALLLLGGALGVAALRRFKR